MIRARDALLAVRPVTVEREVLFGECDPAGFVYTPRFGDYAASASQYFVQDILGAVTDTSSGRVIGLPMKAMSFVFRRFLRPGDHVFMTVSVGDIGRTTFELLIDAAMQDGTPVFDARLRRICFDSERGVAVPIPDVTRAVLENYKIDCAGRAI